MSACVAPGERVSETEARRGMNTTQADQNFLGAEVVVGTGVIGHVDGVVRDPVSERVWRLVTRYGPGRGRQVAVPIEWIVRRSPQRFVLGVGTRSLDQLADYDGASRTYGVAAMSGGRALTLETVGAAHAGTSQS
jgi:hypothetical protein